MLNEIFYAGNGKWLNALQFSQAEEEYKPRTCAEFSRMILTFKPLYILDFYVVDRYVDSIGCVLQLALPNAHTTSNEKKLL